MDFLYHHTKLFTPKSSCIGNNLFAIHEDLGVEIVRYDDIENPIDRLANIVRKNAILLIILKKSFV